MDSILLLSSNRSQMTSNVVKTKKWHTSRRWVCHWCFLPHFYVFCDLLLNRPMVTWNLFVSYNGQKRKKTDIHTCLVSLDCSKIWASLGIFKVPKAIYRLRLDYQPLFGKMSPHSSPEEDQRPVPGDGGNRAYLSSLLLPLFLYFACVSFLETFFEQRLFMLKAECWWWRKHFATQRASRSDDTRWQLWKFLVV